MEKVLCVSAGVAVVIGVIGVYAVVIGVYVFRFPGEVAASCAFAVLAYVVAFSSYANIYKKRK